MSRPGRVGRVTLAGLTTMIDVPVYNESGKKVGTASLDETLFGKEPRPELLKQAIVMYQANRRQGTAATKSRSMVEGSTRKLYRQKGTGNARMGTIRQPVRVGGGNAFAKRVRDFGRDMPKKMRRLARDHAILAKAQASEAVIIDGLKLDGPKTKRVAALLKAIEADRGCVITIAEADTNLYLSSRNIPKTDVRLVDEVNAYEILRRRKLVFTKAAFDRMVAAKKPA